MTRTYYRISLSAICALAAMVGPVHFLEDRFRTDYLLGGLVAAFLGWGFLHLTMRAEAYLPAEIRGVVGATAAVPWATISLVAVFDVLPHLLEFGPARFDPIWLLAGFSPLAVPVVAWWRTRHEQSQFWQALMSTLFRFSVPLFGLLYAARLLGLPKQFRWLFLFTGIMFLILDGLGTGRALPLSSADDQKKQ